MKDFHNPYLPDVAVITDIIEETDDIKRFILRYEDPSKHDSFEYTGQFFQLTVFGAGEITMSIPFSPSLKGSFEFCMKKAGKVTGIFHSLKVGDRVGIRGPFGVGFPYEPLKGRDLLFVASGVGLAPLRSLILRVLENRSEFGKVAILFSALTEDKIIYRDDLRKWGELDNVDVRITLGKSSPGWTGPVGYVNDLLPEVGIAGERAMAFVCGSPRRIKKVAADLLKLDFKPGNIYTTIETHMRCGIGKCGHCKVGSRFICTDGPVFTYEELLKLPPEY